MEDKVTYFAQTDSRNKIVSFGIKAKDRTKHVYVIGKTGMGKSTLLENMAVQDIQGGEGMCFIDPHGKTAELLLEYVPEHRIKDVLYFAPFDLDHPISFNVLEKVDSDKRHLVVSGLMSTFKKIWVDAWSARMEYILGNTLLALLEYPDATLLGVNRMLADKDYRKKVVDNVTDPSVKSFWVDEFAKYTEKFAAEATPAIQNKIGQFTSNALIRNMIGQPQSSFDIRKMMDEKKIIIVNLSKGRIGESNANLLGGMLITKIYLAAMSRADVPDRVLKTLPNFYLFVDEFQSFANESFADILSEARKYKLNLTIAHQYIEQMEEEVRAAVFGNVGTMIMFRVGAYDAEVLEKEYAPQFTAEDMVNLGFTQIYLKLMIDGVSSLPFSATTLPPIKPPEISTRDRVVDSSRALFSQTRGSVEGDIKKWHEATPPASSGKKEKTATGSNAGASSASSSTPRERVSGSGTLSDEIKRQILDHESKGSSTAPGEPIHVEIKESAAGVAEPVIVAAKPVKPQQPVESPKLVVLPVEKQPEVVAAPKPAPARVHVQAAPRSPQAPAQPPREVRKSAEVKVKAPASSGAAEPQKKTVAAEFAAMLKAAPLPVSAEETKKESAPYVEPLAKPVQAAVSLKTLSPQPRKNDQKTPTEKNINDLKSALASALLNTPKKTNVPPGVTGIKGPEELKKEEKKESPPVAAPQVSAPSPLHEIPEDVLTNLLKVDK